jgi:hypothetical protein
MGYRIDPIVAKYQSWGGISERELRTFLQEQKEIQLRTSGLKGSGEMRIYMPSLKRNGYTKVITGTLKKRE